MFRFLFCFHWMKFWILGVIFCQAVFFSCSSKDTAPPKEQAVAEAKKNPLAQADASSGTIYFQSTTELPGSFVCCLDGNNPYQQF